MTLRFNLLRWLALLLPGGLLAGAYISQYVFGLHPCEMCWWQRYPHFAAIGIALVALLMGRAPFAKILVALAALATLTSGVIGGYHAGVEYGWFEGLTKCTSTIGNSGDIMKSIMEAPLIRCDVAPWTLFGISLAGFNFLLSVSGAAFILLAVRTSTLRD